MIVVELQIIQPKLNDDIFGVKTRVHLLHQAVVMQLANRRAGSAATKCDDASRPVFEGT